MSRKWQTYLNMNRRRWDELVPLNAASPSYDLERFKRGRLTISPLERMELGTVRGRSLLHLQCHFGIDTMLWARLGAHATGVDFSPTAIRLARRLAAELDINAKFVLSDVFDLKKNLRGRFDIVYTSMGVLCWLPDLRRWGKIVGHFLKRGGVFYMLESHPFSHVFSDRPERNELEFEAPYFHQDRPERFVPEWSKAPTKERVQYNWQHSLSDILNSLIDGGLRIEFVHEFPYAPWKMFPTMRQGKDRWWRLKKKHGYVPLTFSVRANKPQ